jgi:hypothetical protein
MGASVVVLGRATTRLSSYASYYVGHEVRYPRYICNDCHRPGQWRWWVDFIRTTRIAAWSISA